MLSILSTRRVALWTRLFKQWLTRKFDSISIDLTPVENKLDGIGGKIGTPAEGQPTTLFGAIAAGGSGEDAHNLAQFFGLPEALPGSYVPAAEAEILLELESIWEDVTGELAPLPSFSTDSVQRVVTDGVVSYRSIESEEIG